MNSFFETAYFLGWVLVFHSLLALWLKLLRLMVCKKIDTRVWSSSLQLQDATIIFLLEFVQQTHFLKPLLPLFCGPWSLPPNAQSCRTSYAWEELLPGSPHVLTRALYPPFFLATTEQVAQGSFLLNSTANTEVLDTGVSLFPQPALFWVCCRCAQNLVLVHSVTTRSRGHSWRCARPSLLVAAVQVLLFTFGARWCLVGNCVLCIFLVRAGGGEPLHATLVQTYFCLLFLGLCRSEERPWLLMAMCLRAAVFGRLFRLVGAELAAPHPLGEVADHNESGSLLGSDPEWSLEELHDQGLDENEEESGDAGATERSDTSGAKETQVLEEQEIARRQIQLLRINQEGVFE